MMKTILVPNIGAPGGPNALRLSLQIAHLFDGHIVGLHVHPDVRELARYTSSVDAQSGLHSGQVWEAIVEGDKTFAARSRKTFDEFCKTESLDGISRRVTAEWVEVEGNSREQTLGQALYKDLVVFGRPTPPDDLSSNGVGDMLAGCGRPLLLAPSRRCANTLSTVVIAWKETATSVHAVAAAMPLLAKAQTIHILTIAEHDRDVQSSIASVERLAEHLRWHGLKPQAGHLRSGAHNACDVLLEAAETKLHGGLLVMGGYGHSRARELILGGFTRRVLQSAPLPVFLCH
jgi:nucleotide-binding universal stress UspA family protein